jgi:hypothetical protein
MKFTGMIKTDGLSVCIVIGPQTTKGSSRSKKRARDAHAGMFFVPANSEADEKAANAPIYFQDYLQEVYDDEEYADGDAEHAFNNRKVFIDPNKRDLLFCMSNDDTTQNHDVCFFLICLDSSIHFYE